MDPLLLQTALVYPHGVNFSSNVWVSLLFHDIKNHGQKPSRSASHAFPSYAQVNASPNTGGKVHTNPLVGRDTFWNTPSAIPVNDQLPSPTNPPTDDIPE